MKPSAIFIRCVNLFALSGYLMNVISLLDSSSAPLSKVNGVFHLFMLVFLMTLEIQEPAPNMKFITFMDHAFGRGLFYLWISMITLHDSVISVIGASFTGLVGLVYIACAGFKECCCCKQKRRKTRETALPGVPTESTSVPAAVASSSSSAPIVVTFPEYDVERDDEGESSNLLPVYTKKDPNHF